MANYKCQQKTIGLIMKCWHCNNDLIWGGDHDTEWEDNDGEEHMVVTNLHCPKCKAEVLVYHCNVEKNK